MKKGKLIIAVLFITIFLSISVQAADVPPQPDEEGTWIIDSAEVLSNSEFSSLNEKSNEIYLQSGKPIVILTIESYEIQNAEGWEKQDYARLAFDEYEIIDDNGENKAILIFMSEQDRQFWIELGEGYLGEELDGYVQSIYDNEVRPWLAEDQWFEGLHAAVEGLRPILEEGEIIIPDFDWSDEIWVMDGGNILDSNAEVQLNLMINEIELETSCPIIIITINNLAEKNASLMSFGTYLGKVFDEYGMPDCGIVWGLIEERSEWGTWYQIAASTGDQYNGDWNRYLQDKIWQLQDRLGWNPDTNQASIDMVEYSEKAINDDGFEFNEWLEINSIPILLVPLFLFIGIGLFVYSIPKKLKFRKRKDDALVKIAVINRAIMSNLSGGSSIRSEWNGVFTGMKDSEIKSFRQLDEKLKHEDVNISLEKYGTELEIIKEIYNLRSSRSDIVTAFSIIISFPMVIMLFFSYSNSSTWMMEAQKINTEEIFLGIFLTVFIGFFVGPIAAIFFGMINNGSRQLKTEMALILGLPLMKRRTRDNYRDDNYDHFMWNYHGMRRTFRSSSGSTRSETRSSGGSGGSSGGGGGGGGFSGGGSGGGGGGGGDF